MLRKCTDEDISDEECETIINPFYDNYHTFVEETLNTYTHLFNSALNEVVELIDQLDN